MRLGDRRVFKQTRRYQSGNRWFEMLAVYQVVLGASIYLAVITFSQSSENLLQICFLSDGCRRGLLEDELIAEGENLFSFGKFLN